MGGVTEHLSFWDCSLRSKCECEALFFGSNITFLIAEGGAKIVKYATKYSKDKIAKYLN